MQKKPTYPYPVPALIAHLEATQASDQKDEQDYTVLAKLLQVCYATVENANALWQAGRFGTEEPEIPTYEAIHYGFKRLIPLIIDATVSGWHELLIYIEHPEKYPWYNPETDWPCAPPLLSSPDLEDEETPGANDEQEADTEEVVEYYSVDASL